MLCIVCVVGMGEGSGGSGRASVGSGGPHSPWDASNGNHPSPSYIPRVSTTTSFLADILNTLFRYIKCHASLNVFSPVAPSIIFNSEHHNSNIMTSKC